MSALKHTFIGLALATAVVGNASATNDCQHNNSCGGGQPSGGTTFDNRDNFQGAVVGRNTSTNNNYNSMYSLTQGGSVNLGNGSLSPRSSSRSDSTSSVDLSNVGNGVGMGGAGYGGAGGSSSVNVEAQKQLRWTGSILLGGASINAHTSMVGLCGYSRDGSWNFLGLFGKADAQTMGIDDRKAEGAVLPGETRGEKCLREERAWREKMDAYAGAFGMTQSPDAGIRAAGLATLAQKDSDVSTGLDGIRESVAGKDYKDCVAKRGAGAERDPLEMVLGVPTASCDPIRVASTEPPKFTVPPAQHTTNSYYVLPNVYIAGKKQDKPCDMVEKKLAEAFVCTDGKNKGKVLSEAEVKTFRLDRAVPVAPGASGPVR